MKALKIVPEISYFDTFKEFAENFNLGKGDILVTNKWLFEPLVQPCVPDIQVVYQEKYGAGEPTDEMMDAMKAAMDEYAYDRVIGFGGGTIMDCCKVLSCNVPGKVADLYTGKVQPVREKELILVPTTCGTGSEVTNVAVAAIPSMDLKKGIADPELYADHAVLIPESLAGLPDMVFSASSVDALIHAAEAYVSPFASDYTDILAVRAIEMITRAYMTIAHRGGNSRDNRADLLKDFSLASNLAGIAFGNAGVGAVHALSYAVGGAFHTSHGESNFVCFTEVFKTYKVKQAELKGTDSPAGYTFGADGDKLTALEKLFAGILGCGQDQVYNELDKLLENFISKYPLRDKGMTEEQIGSFAKNTIENQQRLLVNNYAPLSEQDIADIFARLY